MYIRVWVEEESTGQLVMVVVSFHIFKEVLTWLSDEKPCGIFSLHLPQCTCDASLRLFIYNQPKLSKLESFFSLTFREIFLLSNIEIKADAASSCTILLLQQCHLMAKGKRCAGVCARCKETRWKQKTEELHLPAWRWRQWWWWWWWR